MPYLIVVEEAVCDSVIFLIGKLKPDLAIFVRIPANPHYGSGSIESAEFTAIMFTIIQTLLIWGINPQTWFNGLGSNWHQKFDQWLPWNMSSKERESFSLKRGYDPPS